MMIDVVVSIEILSVRVVMMKFFCRMLNSVCRISVIIVFVVVVYMSSVMSCWIMLIMRNEIRMLFSIFLSISGNDEVVSLILFLLVLVRGMIEVIFIVIVVGLFLVVVICLVSCICNWLVILVSSWFMMVFVVGVVSILGFVLWVFGRMIVLYILWCLILLMVFVWLLMVLKLIIFDDLLCIVFLMVVILVVGFEIVIGRFLIDVVVIG